MGLCPRWAMGQTHPNRALAGGQRSGWGGEHQTPQPGPGRGAGPGWAPCPAASPAGDSRSVRQVRGETTTDGPSSATSAADRGAEPPSSLDAPDTSARPKPPARPRPAPGWTLREPPTAPAGLRGLPPASLALSPAGGVAFNRIRLGKAGPGRTQLCRAPVGDPKAAQAGCQHQTHPTEQTRRERFGSLVAWPRAPTPGGRGCSARRGLRPRDRNTLNTQTLDFVRVWRTGSELATAAALSPGQRRVWRFLGAGSFPPLSPTARGEILGCPQLRGWIPLPQCPPPAPGRAEMASSRVGTHPGWLGRACLSICPSASPGGQEPCPSTQGAPTTLQSGALFRPRVTRTRLGAEMSPCPLLMHPRGKPPGHPLPSPLPPLSWTIPVPHRPPPTPTPHLSHPDPRPCHPPPRDRPTGGRHWGGLCTFGGLG